MVAVNGFTSVWQVVGIVQGVRELKSEKNKEWRGYVVKVATIGSTFELSVTKEQMAAVGAGQHLDFRGHFEPRADRVNLVVDAFTQYEAAKGGARG